MQNGTKVKTCGKVACILDQLFAERTIAYVLLIVSIFLIVLVLEHVYYFTNLIRVQLVKQGVLHAHCVMFVQLVSGLSYISGQAALYLWTTVFLSHQQTLCMVYMSSFYFLIPNINFSLQETSALMLTFRNKQKQTDRCYFLLFSFMLSNRKLLKDSLSLHPNVWRYCIFI